jgi:hypothetical protein
MGNKYGKKWKVVSVYSGLAQNLAYVWTYLYTYNPTTSRDPTPSQMLGLTGGGKFFLISWSPSLLVGVVELNMNNFTCANSCLTSHSPRKVMVTMALIPNVSVHSGIA